MLQVTVISTSSSKQEEALLRLGADKFVVSKDPEQMAAAAGTLHGIIDTVSGAGVLHAGLCSSAIALGAHAWRCCVRRCCHGSHAPLATQPSMTWRATCR